VATKRSKRKALPNNKLGRLTEKLEHLKASVRAKVEHPFHAVKNLFRHRKTRHRGLAKNTAQLFYLVCLCQFGAGQQALYRHRNPKSVLIAERRPIKAEPGHQR
jgi:IS5 family transposase